MKMQARTQGLLMRRRVVAAIVSACVALLAVVASAVPASADPLGLPVVENLTLTPGVNSVTLSWSPVAGADDYFVYAAPGCDVLPPPNSTYQRVQWFLGTRTTWTHEFVFDMCMNYFVVAVNNGFQGAEPPFGKRALPYHNNVSWNNIQFYYMDGTGPLADGDQVFETSVAPGPDRGVVLARAFIRNKDWFTEAIGDRRDWTTKEFPDAKVTFAWDTGTGKVVVYARRSCAVGANLPGGPIQTLCRDALPIALVADAAAVNDGSTDRHNFVSVLRTRTGGLRIGLSAWNSWDHICVGPVCAGPGFGRINARATIEPSSGETVSARLVGDKFPAWEFIRYPKYQQTDPLGLGLVIGTRDQTQISDLTSGTQSTCTSVAPEVRERFTNPMSC